MASSQIAAMLDELMGRNRNLAPDDAANREIKWTDPDVCRYYLVHFCPHDLFTNTKADLGPCGKIHDDDLKQKFADEKESYKKSQYLDEFLRFCQKSLADLQARIKKAKERLILTQQAEEAKLNAGGMGVSGGQNREVDEKIILLSEKISALVAEAEQAGCRGDVEEAQGLMKLCDQLRDERDTLRRTVAVSNYGNDYGTIQKAMEVCDICGAFLIVGDAQQRIDDHLLGKQHVGYARLRAAVDQLMEQRRLFREGREKEAEDRRKLKEAKEAEEAKEAKEAKPEKSSTTETSSSSSTKKRSRSKDRDRDRDRDRGDRDTRRRGGSRDRDRSDRDRRDRDQRRNNDRDRDRNRGDRRRDRGRRDRSRSRDRDRHSKRRRDSRSRSRDRNHSSSSKKDSSKSPSREATTTEQQQLPKVDPAPKVIDPAGPEVNDEVGEAAVPMVADGASPAKVVNDDAAAPPPAGSGNNGHQD
jgi:hypothetical protein